MTYFLGIDTSTTATKALLMNEIGEVIGVGASGYSYETPKPLWSEQDPNLWWGATVESIRQVLTRTEIEAQKVAGVGLTGQMHGLVLLDKAGEVLRPAILWNDQRTAAACEEIRRRLGRERLIQVTGNDALTGFTAPKILWVKQYEPDLFRRTAQILLPKDYVRYKLTGAYATDKAGAAGTLLFNLEKRDWSSEVTMALEIDSAWLPPTFEGTAVTGYLSPEAAEMTGLKAGTPVVGGGGDQAAGAVGMGAVTEGIISVSLGTSGVVFASVNRPLVEPEGRLHAFCHALPERWHLMGVMLSAAGSLRWYRDTLVAKTGYDALIEQTRGLAPGSEGLLFLPYLTGERTPYPDPLARGAFVGLTVRHTQAHLTRAVLEGVAFGLRDGFELLKSVGLSHIEQVRISGGGARNPHWLQIIADVLDAKLVTVNTTEGAAYGAALLAGVSGGAWADVEVACQSAINLTGSIAPNPEAVEQYDEVYAVYRELYPALKGISHRVNDF